MEHIVISMREIQRNYKKILEKAKKSRKPVFLGAHGRAQAVLMDINEFENLKSQSENTQRKMKWEEMERVLGAIASKGRQDISLSEFIVHDRHAH